MQEIKKIWAKIKPFVMFLLYVTGIMLALWFVMTIVKLIKGADPGAETELETSKDGLKEVEKSISLSWPLEHYAELSTRMYLELTNTTGLRTNMATMQKFLMDIKHYGDFLKLKAVFGEQKISWYRGKGTLTDAVVYGSDDLAQAYYNQYVKSLYDNYVKRFKKK